MNDSSHPSSEQNSQENEKSPDRSSHNSDHADPQPVNSVFNPEEIQNLKDIFELFDKDQAGKIETSDLENILTSLKRDPEEAKQMLDEIDPHHSGQISLTEFITLMAKIENKIDAKSPIQDDNLSQQNSDLNSKPLDAAKRTTIQTDSRVLEFLVLLENHRSQ